MSWSGLSVQGIQSRGWRSVSGGERGGKGECPTGKRQKMSPADPTFSTRCSFVVYTIAMKVLKSVQCRAIMVEDVTVMWTSGDGVFRVGDGVEVLGSGCRIGGRNGSRAVYDLFRPLGEGVWPCKGRRGREEEEGDEQSIRTKRICLTPWFATPGEESRNRLLLPLCLRQVLPPPPLLPQLLPIPLPLSDAVTYVCSFNQCCIQSNCYWF